MMKNKKLTILLILVLIFIFLGGISFWFYKNKSKSLQSLINIQKPAEKSMSPEETAPEKIEEDLKGIDFSDFEKELKDIEKEIEAVY